MPVTLLLERFENKIFLLSQSNKFLVYGFFTPMLLHRFKHKAKEHIWILFTKLSLLSITIKHEQWILTNYIWCAHSRDSECCFNVNTGFFWRKKLIQVNTSKSGGKRNSCFTSIHPVVSSKNFLMKYHLSNSCLLLKNAHNHRKVMQDIGCIVCANAFNVFVFQRHIKSSKDVLSRIIGKPKN